MKEVPEISIIVPYYNEKRYLSQCLNAILNQTYRDFELILIDDGSDDGSAAVGEIYASADERIKLIKGRHSGVSSSRNQGLDAAKGKYIVFIDADDLPEKNMLESLYEAEIRTQADYIACGYTLLESPKGNLNYSTGFGGRLYSGKEIREEVIPNYLHPGSTLFVHNRFYKRRLIEQNSIRFLPENKVFSEDSIFNFNYLEYAQSAFFINLSLYGYRWHHGSLTEIYRYKLEEMIKNLSSELKRLFYSMGLEGFDYLVDRRMKDAMIYMIFNESKAEASAYKKIGGIRTILTDRYYQKILRLDRKSEKNGGEKLFYGFCRRRQAALLYLLFLLHNEFKKAGKMVCSRFHDFLLHT